jgi:hypothetical protein
VNKSAHNRPIDTQFNRYRYIIRIQDSFHELQFPSQRMMIVSILLSIVFVPTSVRAQGIPRDEIPFIHLAFPGYEEPPYFPAYEKLLGSDLLKRCVKREFPPTSGSRCRKDPKVCLWGQQTCANVSPSGADEVQPTTRCNCLDSVWQCQSFECPTFGGFCPVQVSSSVLPTPICMTDLNCVYEEQTCCGHTFAKKT